jgi:hypothetical protein
MQHSIKQFTPTQYPGHGLAATPHVLPHGFQGVENAVHET